MLVPITFLDILDIFLVAIILYQVFILIKGTSAFSIFLVVFLLYVFWLLVKALDMSLTSALMGQVMGVGVIALDCFSTGDKKIFVGIGEQVYQKQPVYP